MISGAAKNGTIHFDDMNLTNRFGALRAVMQFCQANDLFTQEFADRLGIREHASVTITCLKVGVVKTHIRRRFPTWMKWFVPLVLDPLLALSAGQVAHEAMRLLVDPAFEEVTGAFFQFIRTFKAIDVPTTVRNPELRHCSEPGALAASSSTRFATLAPRYRMKSLMTRRVFARVSSVAAGAAIAPALLAQSSVPAAESGTLQSELLLDMMIDTQPVNSVGSVGVNRLIVPVSGGVFDGPRLKGTIVGPSGDWIVARPDGSSVLDVRLVLQTDDQQKIYMAWRGISYTPQGGTQYARILALFETGAAKYAWLNNLVAVGVYRPMPAKVAYRVYRIL